MTNKQASTAKIKPLEHRINHISLYSYMELNILPIEKYFDKIIVQLNNIYGVYARVR